MVFRSRSAQVSFSAYCKRGSMPSSSPASSRMRCTSLGGSNVSPTFLAGSTMVRSSSERSIEPSRTCRGRQQRFDLLVSNQRIVEIGTDGGDHCNRRGFRCSEQQVDETIDIGGVLSGALLVTAGRRLRVEFLPLVDIKQQPVRLAFRLIQLLADHVRQQLGVTYP